MIRFTVERVLLLHQLMIEQTGGADGADGVRDRGLLESMFAGFEGRELFPARKRRPHDWAFP